MSYVAKARQNRMNAEKAQAFDALQQRQRDDQAYTAGINDAYTDVEQALMERFQPTMYAANTQPAPQAVRLPAPKPTNDYDGGLAASIQDNMRDNAYTAAIARARREGNMSDDYINSLVEQELNKIGGL